MLTQENMRDLSIEADVPLSTYTFTRVGGPADFLAHPKNLSELADLLKLARKNAIPLTVLGNASNLIVCDGGIRGLVILLDKLTTISFEGKLVTAGAGINLSELTALVARHSLAGFEFACGIPGSVGGAVYMNAGAYGRELEDVFHSVDVVNYSGQVMKLYKAEMAFGYRHSIIQDNDLIVLSATFELKNGHTEDIQAEMAHLMDLRRAKQPLEYPSCGSVFKRPEGHFAGQLIQEAGCQGHRIGGVEVSSKHAGFMVNVDHGTATDYENLIHWVVERVREHSGVTLEPEVRIIGEEA